MHIAKFRLENYKSFLDSGEISLNEGINIITGQNNSGKTALLQGLSLMFAGKPHKSSKTIPLSISRPNGISTAEVTFVISKEELITYILDYESRIALPEIVGHSHDYYSGKDFFLRRLQDNNNLTCEIKNQGITHGRLNNDNVVENGQLLLFSIDKPNKRLNFFGSTSDSGQNFYSAIAAKLRERIYIFQAERLNISTFAIGENRVLNSNASNLPEVLNILQSEKFRFSKYINYVRKIFPQIHDISIRPIAGQRVEIVIWNEDPSLDRGDLVVPLSECGTGLGQVMAILYVVLTSDISKVIIVDEPNSFLHPGASRKLIEILKEHPQHQFIISTHSPATIAASNPRSINILRYENAQSIVEMVDISDVNEQQMYLAEIGSKLSDVYGADNILWVEGKTEEICVPKIIEATEGVSLMGTTVLSVIHTGDFQKKRGQYAELIFSIYDRLSKGKGLLPPAIGFLFDSEGLTKTEQDDLKRKSNNGVKFTYRKMFENYLLNPKAIHAVINDPDNNLSSEITLEQIEKWLELNKWDPKLIASRFKEEADWLVQVHGAKLLVKLFSDLTEKKLSFDKIKHSVALCEWIIENSIEDLSELQATLKDILK